MAREIKACVHCGFCLPVCPTYRVLGEEMDSPRGRIFLMKEVLEEELSLEEALPYIDKCLGCLGCVPACPSGVEYGELVTSFRAHAQQHRKQSVGSWLTRTMVRHVLPFPGRFRSAARLGKIARPLRRLFPDRIASMLTLLPDNIREERKHPVLQAPVGERRARVAFLTGCVQQVLAPQINAATLRVLALNGVEVVVPQGQGCCGSLAMHTGNASEARELAKVNFQTFPGDVDAIITNAAGCGSGMKEYPLLFKGQPEEEKAQSFASKVKDVSEFLFELGLRHSPTLSGTLTLAYHDACHLLHAQGIRQAPRKLLASIPGVNLREIPDGEICCGSAGTYNIDQPRIAARLGEEKAERILKTGAEGVVAGNIGCLVQIRSALEALNRPLPVYHTIEVLDRAYASMNSEELLTGTGREAMPPEKAST